MKSSKTLTLLAIAFMALLLVNYSFAAGSSSGKTLSGHDDHSGHDHGKSEPVDQHAGHDHSKHKQESPEEHSVHGKDDHSGHFHKKTGDKSGTQGKQAPGSASDPKKP